MSDPQSDIAEDPEAKVRTPRFEILIAVLLGVTALLTAGAAYLADRDDGNQLRYLQQAARTQAESNDNFALGDQLRALDQSIFVQYSIAVTGGDRALADYLLGFSPDLRKAINTWVNDPSSPQTPFTGDTPAYYPAAYDEGQRLKELSQEEFDRGDFYDQRGDDFVAASVLLIVALALFGVASTIWFRRWRYGLTAGGSLFLIAGTAMIVVTL
jgi:type II secretory pathway pseudopilin PulG